MSTIDIPRSTSRRTKETIFITKSSRTDIYLLLVTFLLVVFGLIMMYSASYIKAYSNDKSGMAYLTNQAVFAVIGISAMLLISHINYRVIHTLSWPPYFFIILSLLLMVLTLVGNRSRWLGVGDAFQFQPSELAKLAVIIFISHLASLNPVRMKNSFKYGFVQPIAYVAGFAIIMLIQPHYSGLFIIAGLTITMMFVGGTKFKWFAVLGLLIAGLVLLLLLLDWVPPYVKNRIDTWRNSSEVDNDSYYQTEQSLIAIGSGGFSGLGLGNSRQKHHFLPEPQNDFLFAIVCEELGFVGGLFIIGLFTYFIVRGINISLNAKDRFGAMLAIGITVEIAIQVILNIAVVTDTITNTGISLPFFSQGGTSLIVLLAEVGLLLSIARYTNTTNRLKTTSRASTGE
ncbi:MAG: FtsW/RodA/SpoVE family cell cycle protein [Oscillospiraceae bacterium]|nr:FtsW/RodA/SpoVE family cell cycle protein [Oscillospiraceae bacterium]